MKTKYFITGFGPDDFMIADGDKSKAIPDNRYYLSSRMICLPGKNNLIPQKCDIPKQRVDLDGYDDKWENLEKDISELRTICPQKKNYVPVVGGIILESIVLSHEGDIVRIVFISRLVTFVKGRKFKRDDRYSTTYVLNTRSGYTYKLPECGISRYGISSHDLYVGDKTYGVSRVGCYKYSSATYDMPLWEKLPLGIRNIIINEVQKAKGEQYGFTPTFYGNTFRDLVAYNRYPENSRVLETAQWWGAKDLRSFKKYVLKADDPFRVLCEAFELPANKLIRKFFLADEESLKFLRFIYKLGVTQADDVRLLMQNKKSVFWDTTYIPSPALSVKKGKLTIKDGPVSNTMNEFLVLFERIKGFYNGNIHLTTKWFSRTSVYQSDIIRMLGYIEEKTGHMKYFSKSLPFHNKTEMRKWIKKEYLSDWDKKDHDDMSTVYNLITKSNQKIRLVDGEKKLEDVIDGYRFNIAKDTHTLRAIGSEMTICVGSYDRMAVDKRCTIAYVTSKNDYECCIELGCGYSSDNSKRRFAANAYQVKLKYNKLLRNTPEKVDLSEAIKKWMQKHKINCATEDFKEGPVYHYGRLEPLPRPKERVNQYDKVLPFA